jgi:hypothetical protein
VTEQEWDRCTDPVRMLGFLGARKRPWLAWLRPRRARPGDRKLQLFVAGCCRRVWPLFGDDRSRRAVEVVERHADALAGAAELRAARKGAQGALAAAEALTQVPGDADERALYAAVFARPKLAQARMAVLATVAGEWISAAQEGVEAAAAELASDALFSELQREMTDALMSDAQAGARRGQEREAQCALLRDVFGPLPFRPVALDPAWLAWHGGAVKRLAEAVYEERELPSGHLDAPRLAVLADMLEEAGCSDAHLLGHLRGPGPHVRGCFAIDALSGRP